MSLKTQMSLRTQLVQTLERFDEVELRQIAEYMAFLRFRTRLQLIPSPETTSLATLYAQFAQEDRDLAEAGLGEYATTLCGEDKL